MNPQARKEQTPKRPPKQKVMMPKITSPTQVKHELVVLTNTKFWQNDLCPKKLNKIVFENIMSS